MARTSHDGKRSNFQMRTKRTILFLFASWALLCVLAHSAFAQKLLLRRYDVADGLANSTVTAIYQDKKGFLWISTQEGLSRFDGYAFTNYGVRDGLGHHIVNDVAEDKLGRLWAATNGGGVSLLIERQVGTPKGLNVKAHKKFISFPVGPKRGADNVNRIHFDSKDNLWCVTDLGLYRASLSDLADLKFKPVLEKLSVNAWALIEDSRGRIWCGLGNELFEIKDGQLINHGSSGEGADTLGGGTGERGDFIKGIVETKGGRLLLATAVALYEFTQTEGNGAAAWSKQSLSLDGQKIYTIFADSNANLWVSTFGVYDGLIKYQNGQLHRYSKSEGISYPVRAIAEDGDGNVWLGTIGGGLHKFSGEAFVAYMNPKDSSPLIATDVFEDYEGRLVAALGDSLVEVRESELRPLTKPDYAPSISRYAAIEATAGALWRAGATLHRTSINQPVVRLRNGQTVSLKGFFKGAVRRVIHYYEDERGRLWLVDEDDVYRADAGSQAIAHQGTLPRNFLLHGSGPQIISDRAGGLWFSSSVGLCRLRENKFKCFQPVDGLPVINPRALFVDSRGWLWIGQRYDGVSMTKNPEEEQPRFINYTTELPSNAVWSITEDDLGRMYFGTERGVQQFDVGKTLWRTFNSKNGLSGDRINSLVKDRRGNIWIVTSSGLMKFNPLAERISSRPPPIYLSRVKIAGEDLPLAEAGVNRIPLIELPSARNNLTIEFVGLNFMGEDNLNYQYKIEGIDADWNAPTRQRFVNYASLAAGSYRFFVRAINREGVTSTSPAAFEFRILPPIYLRWWFIALCALAAGSLAAAAYRYRVSRLLELERVRTRIATDLHDDIGANLTRISLLSEVAKQGNGNRTLLTSIADIARESVSSLNDIVWAISPEHDRLLDLTRRMRQHAEDVFALRDIELNFNAPSPDADIKLSVGERRDVLLIFKEAVNNAARHSECTKVVIDLHPGSNGLHLQISDNGRGFAIGSESGGQGLRSMSRRAAALGGQLQIDSRPGEGTTVRFELPSTSAGRV